MSCIAPLNLIEGDGERTSRSHVLLFVSFTSARQLEEVESLHRLKVSKETFLQQGHRRGFGHDQL